MKISKIAKDKDEDILNDRPPLFLQATINDPKTNKPFAVTVINNHLKSFLGYNDLKDGGLRVRTKKKIQAEYLAKVVQERQKANPNENIVLLGDFNAYQFNDGITDIIGTIKGTPASKEEVLMASDDLVNPDLIDLVDLIQADQRYSYTYDGNAQVLDHILINQPLRKYLTVSATHGSTPIFPKSIATIKRESKDFPTTMRRLRILLSMKRNKTKIES